jgi:predicted nucleic acid-binding Zn ribbon protein
MSKIIGMDGANTPPRSNVNINPNDLKDVVCENCGGKFFRQVNAFKRVSALISPTGKEQIIPVPTFRCDDCGHINDEFQLT